MSLGTFCIFLFLHFARPKSFVVAARIADQTFKSILIFCRTCKLRWQREAKMKIHNVWQQKLCINFRSNVDELENWKLELSTYSRFIKVKRLIRDVSKLSPLRPISKSSFPFIYCFVVTQLRYRCDIHASRINKAPSLSSTFVIELELNSCTINTFVIWYSIDRSSTWHAEATRNLFLWASFSPIFNKFLFYLDRFEFISFPPLDVFTFNGETEVKPVHIGKEVTVGESVRKKMEELTHSMVPLSFNINDVRQHTNVKIKINKCWVSEL